MNVTRQVTYEQCYEQTDGECFFILGCEQKILMDLWDWTRLNNFYWDLSEINSV